MHTIQSKVTAIHLFSGGLDSLLAAKILEKQGITVKCINFVTPFYGIKDPEKVSQKYNLDIQTIKIFDEYVDILLNPVYGYGKNMNPCIDCHAYMMKRAYEIALTKMPAFVSTGEVLEQRPKSQSIAGMHSVLKLSKLKGMVVRPLCQKLLAETEPEKKGWVNRELLYGISGRSRKIQIKLAEEFGIKDYPTPAGGCLLTDPGFSRRLKEHTNFCQKNRLQLLESDIEFLKYGRHFRMNKSKLIIGRDNEDNMGILNIKSDEHIIFRLKEGTGPIGALCGEKTEKACFSLAYLIKRYSRYRDNENIEIKDSLGNIYNEEQMAKIDENDYKMI